MDSDRRAARERSVHAGLQGFCRDQGLGSPPVGEIMAAFLCQGLVGRASSTKGTYHSVLRHFGEVAEPQGAPRFAGSRAPAPYDARERAQLYSVASSQGRPWRRYSAMMLLTLGIGAGLRTSELVAARGRDVTIDPTGVTLHVRGARRRVVTLRGDEAAALGDLVGRKSDYLFHPEPATRSYPNFVNDFCRQLVAGPDVTRLSTSRARSSYICDHLTSGTRLSALLEATGLVEVESLARYARHVPSAPHSKAALRRQLASES